MPSKQKSPDSIKVREQADSHEEFEESSDLVVDEVRDESEAKKSTLSLKLSATLVRKLGEKAQMEGVSVEDFASELLAEGLVLRAWEIVEKKNAMRGTNASGPSPSQGNNYRNQKFGYRNNNNQNGYVKRMSNDSGAPQKPSRQSYKNIMEDNANFLEYVRSQEKRDKY